MMFYERKYQEIINRMSQPRCLQRWKREEKIGMEIRSWTEFPGPGKAKLASVKRMLSGPKERKKGGEMLVLGKAPCPVDHDDY